MISFDVQTKCDVYTKYLQEHGLIKDDDRVSAVTKAGEGNMNVVVRLQTDERSLILKQSRPYVHKYPQIAAPLERIVVESRFYEVVEQQEELADKMPRILLRDLSKSILVMEDLGNVQDYTSLYAKGVGLNQGALNKLIEFLAGLHQISTVEMYEFPANLELRKLNHEHIFVYPFMLQNDFNLDEVTPGLQDLSMKYKEDESLRSIVEEVGQYYLGTGSHLLHGDYYPGSWIDVDGNPMILDPEFAFVGPAEFDLGVMRAHLQMARVDLDAFNISIQNRLVDLDHSLLRRFCGIEILRRVIGLAQLPLDADLAEKASLLEDARRLVLN